MALKFMSTLLVVLAVAMFVPTRVLAQDPKFDPSSQPINNVGGCDGAAASSPVCQDLKSTGNPLFGPDGILTKVANIFAVLTGIIATFMIILSGVRYVLSGGDPAKTTSARNGIVYSAIGIIVASFAGGIAQFLLTKL